jgi:hypothetical protein
MPRPTSASDGSRKMRKGNTLFAVTPPSSLGRYEGFCSIFVFSRIHGKLLQSYKIAADKASRRLGQAKAGGSAAPAVSSSISELSEDSDVEEESEFGEKE